MNNTPDNDILKYQLQQISNILDKDIKKYRFIKEILTDIALIVSIGIIIFGLRAICQLHNMNNNPVEQNQVQIN